jgi:hypothetical protein
MPYSSAQEPVRRQPRAAEQERRLDSDGKAVEDDSEHPNQPKSTEPLIRLILSGRTLTWARVKG